MNGEASELRALLKMIRDFGGSASWPVLVNNCDKYGISLLNLKALLEIAEISPSVEIYKLKFFNL